VQEERRQAEIAARLAAQMQAQQQQAQTLSDRDVTALIQAEVTIPVRDRGLRQDSSQSIPRQLAI
jgi:hypothetical protein